MKILTVLIALFIMMSAGVVYAKDNASDRTASTTRGDVRSDIKGDGGLHLGIVMRIRDEALRFWTLLNAHIDRLEKIIARLTERANELDTEGVDTAPGRAHLTTATTELTAAKTDLAALKTAVQTAASSTASTTPEGRRAEWSAARALMKSARAHLEEGYREVRAAIKAFKDAVKGENNN